MVLDELLKPRTSVSVKLAATVRVSRDFSPKVSRSLATMSMPRVRVLMALAKNCTRLTGSVPRMLLTMGFVRRNCDESTIRSSMSIW